MKNQQMDTARRTLLDRERSLIRRRSVTLADEKALRETPAPELEETAAKRTAAEMLSTLSEAEQMNLRRVQRALQRIDSGTYGRCPSCGEAIEAARLRVLPEAERCARCSALH